MLLHFRQRGEERCVVGVRGRGRHWGAVVVVVVVCSLEVLVGTEVAVRASAS